MSPSERIMKRLQGMEALLGPPQTAEPKPPVPDITEAMLLEKQVKCDIL